ncbi:MAG: hypothetical protein ACERKO_08420, partial [Acetanaerobacterium sp.]
MCVFENKSIALFALTLSISFLLSACGTAGVPPQGVSDSESGSAQEESINGGEPADLNDIDDVTETYVAPLNDDCLHYSWANASKINVYDLISICAYNNFLNTPPIEQWQSQEGPAKEVESAMQRHFDVSADYLRTSWMYEEETQTYRLYNPDKEQTFRAISATQKGSRIEIEVGLTVPDTGETEDKETTLLAEYAAVNYQPYGEGRLIFPSGTLTVELTGDNVVRYISYQCNETFQKETDKLNLYEQYAHAFVFNLGRDSWERAEQIEPDAFVVYYIYLCGTGEVTRPMDVPIEEEFGSPYMPEEVLEAAVMRHFDITPEHIRKSKYYDKEKGFYWSGGIGTTVDMEIVG